MRSAWTLHHHLFRSLAHSLCLAGVVVLATGRLPAQTQNGSSSSSLSPSSTNSANPVTISGVVVNASTGQPVGRALVRFNDRAMLTTSEGKFEFDQVTEASGNLQVIKPGYYASLEPGSPSGTYLSTGQIAAPLQLRLYPEALFTGTVTAPDGEPLPHVLVTARRSAFEGSGHVLMPVAQKQTDSHGRFRLTVPAGDYKLETMYVPRINGTDQGVLPVIVPAESASNTSNFIHIRSGEEQHFDLRPMTSRAYTVTASFDSEIGRGFPRITARSSNGTTISLPVRFSHYETSGSARMELPSGTYTLDVTIASREGSAAEQGEASVTVPDHDISGVVFHLSPVPSLPVELVLDGAGTSDNQQLPNLRQFGLTLEKEQLDPDTFNLAIALAAQRDGTMMFTAPPGEYRLRARSNSSGSWYVKSASYGTSDVLQQEIVVGPGAGGTPIRITASNQTASLQGTCKLSGVVSDCWVYLIPTTPSATSVFIAHGNAQGVYNYAYLPPGSYQAIAFERMHSADYGDPATLVPFTTHVHGVTLNAGEKPTLDLDTVSEAEMVP